MSRARIVASTLAGHVAVHLILWPFGRLAVWTTLVAIVTVTPPILWLIDHPRNPEAGR